MKKITGLLLGIIGAVCLVVAPTKFSESVIAEETTLENITWNNNDLYVTETVAEVMPKTFEAWLQLDASISSKGGTVFGNYGANSSFSRYKIESYDSTSLEIDTKGNPRLYYETPDRETVSVKFGNVDVRGDEFVHLVITRDEDTAYCYLNGELKETAEFVLDDFVSVYQYAIGSDYRTGRDNYFKGKISEITVYSDTRTQAEIFADMTTVDAQDENLMFSYDLTGKAGADEISDVSANKNDLIRTWLWADEVEIPEYAYSMIALGDTQKANIYHQSGKINFDTIYDYIVENAESQKLKYVFGLGDITDESQDGEFTTAKENWEKLDEVVPYSLVRGNHETIDGFAATWGGTQSTYSKQYFAAYDEETALTTAHKFSVGKLDYLVIALSWAPSDEEIAWASDVVAAHPYHNVIVTTHGFTDANGEILEYWSDKGKNYADRIWDNLVKKHENIVLVMSGHITSKRIEMFQRQGENGNTITQLLIDPSWLDTDMVSKGGTGLIANLFFSEDGSQVSVNWYSPIQQKYYNYHSVYSFELATVARKQISVEVNGAGGTITPETTEVTGEPIDITFNPDKNYRLSKVTLDGVDITANVVDNVYTLTETEGALAIVAEFEPILYGLSIQNAEDKGVVLLNVDERVFFEGTQLNWEIVSRSGWKVAKVIFNGTILQKNIDGAYSATIENKENVLVVEYEEVIVPSIKMDQIDADENGQEDNNIIANALNSIIGGCGGSVASGALTSVVACGLFLCLKRKKDD